MKNIFIRRIILGKLRTQQQLKALFRQEAFRLHPDTSASDGRLFAELRLLYEEALEYLLETQTTEQGKERGEDEGEAKSGSPGITKRSKRSSFLNAWNRFLYRNHFGSLGKLRLTPHYEESLKTLRKALKAYAGRLLDTWGAADRAMALLKQGVAHEKRARELWDRAFRSISTYNDDGFERNLRIADSCAEDAHSYLSLSNSPRYDSQAIKDWYDFLRENILRHGPVMNSWIQD
jgi:hypothetical protein